MRIIEGNLIYKIIQLMIALMEASGRCKRALWDPSCGSPLSSMDGLGTKHSSLVPTVWNYGHLRPIISNSGSGGVNPIKLDYSAVYLAS